ncbi:MAG: type II secretion system F family protein [bacterium]
MDFSYKVKTKEGQIIDSTMESSDRFSLARELRSRGYTLISIKALKGNSFNLDLMVQRFFGRIKNEELIIFTKNLSGMLKAGLSLSRAISVLQKQTKNQKFNDVLTSLNNEINVGGTFSGGLGKFPKVFSKLFVSMIRAGEESGNVSGALTEVGMNIEKSNSLTKKIKGALMYPGVILSAMVLIGILMFAFVVPTLAKTFQDTGAELPGSTRFIIGLGEFFSHNLILSLVSVICIGVGAVYLFKAPFMSKYIDYFVLKIPAIGEMTKQLNTARTARSLSSLLLSGVPIIHALEITQDVVQNIYYKKVLEDAKETIEKGSPLSEILKSNSNLYPVMMSEMVQVGEETGKLADMLLQIALFYEEEIENKTKNLSTIIEPVLMVFIGVAVGFFAVSMISPMYKVMDGIK